MKIVKKIKLWLERDENGNVIHNNLPILHEYIPTGPTGRGKWVVLMRADDISGEMFAMSEIAFPESEKQESEIYFYPKNNSKYYDNLEYQFRRHPDKRNITTEEEDSPEYLKQVKKAYVPLKIPPGTKEIHLKLWEDDYIQIEAHYKEEYVIVDDNGNEIPLEDLLGGKKQSASP